MDRKLIRLKEDVHIICVILKLAPASAVELKLGALFLNTEEAKILWLILHEFGHSQPPTPIQVNNTTAISIVNRTIKRQQSLALVMR